MGTLKLAYPQRIAELESAHASLVESKLFKECQEDAEALDDTAREVLAAREREATAILSKFLNRLGPTGLDHSKRLQLYWPLSEGVPDALELSEDLPGWTKYLEDSPTSGAFAVISPRCLKVRGRFTMAGQRVRGRCSHGMGPSAQVFETVINLHVDSTEKLPAPLQPGAILKTPQGYLMLEHCTADGHFALFQAKGPAAMVKEMVTCRLDGRKAHTHFELLNEQRSSEAYCLYV